MKSYFTNKVELTDSNNLLTDAIGGYSYGTTCPFKGFHGKVYTLSDKEGNVFYVGATILPIPDRLRQHIGNAKATWKRRRPNAKNERIASLNYDIVATIIHVEWVTGRNIQEIKRKLEVVERRYIAEYLNMGVGLLNVLSQSGYRSLNPAKVEEVGQVFHSNLKRA